MFEAGKGKNGDNYTYMHLQAWFFVAGSVGFIMTERLCVWFKSTDAAVAGGCVLSALCQRVHMTGQAGLVIVVCEACYFLY